MILWGYVIGGVTRGVLVAIIVTAVSLFFTKLAINNISIVLAVVILTSILFALFGFINGVFANTFDDISIVPTFVLTPLTYLGGVFYSLDLLPEFWANVSRANPLVYVVNAFRYGMLGVSDVNIQVAFSMIIGFVIAAYVYSLYLLNSGKRLRS